MQNITTTTSDTVSANEAQEVLKAWTNRQQAQGVDASVNSVQALAAGLGVPEDEVRKLLEDIRVQQRSHEIAAGILEKEQKHRKRADITAALLAAGAIIFVGLAIIVFFAVRQGFRHSGPIPPPAPYATLPPSGATEIVAPDGTTIIKDQYGTHITTADGGSIQVDAGTAEKLAKIKEKEALIEKSGPLENTEESKELRDLEQQAEDIEKHVGKKAPLSTSVPPPATPASP